MNKKRFHILSICILISILASYTFCFPAFATINQSNPESEIGNDNMRYNSDDKDDVASAHSSSLNFFVDFLIPLGIQILGVAGGLLGTIAIGKLTNKRQRRELDFSLRNEIKTIHDELELRLAQEEDYSWYQYSTPVWDINLASGSLSFLANHHIYKKYIGIYSNIQYAQELEKEYTHSKLLQDSYAIKHEGGFLNDYISDTDAARKECAKKICKMILELLKDVK